MKIRPFLLILISLALLSPSASAQYPAWQHSAPFFILTTPQGADLPPSASEENFPLLLRLHKDFFDFSQAQPAGQDIRFSSPDGKPLSYQIEDWNAANQTATLWLRIPLIKGNQRQEIRMFWGNPIAPSESSGPAVFNASNGYLSVWHMSDPLQDEVGTLKSTNVGTTAAPGLIGPARHFAGQQGIFGGDKIPNYPSGASPHSTEAWFRAQAPNSTLIAWGNEPGGRGTKVRMQLRSPPHIHIDSNFSDVNGKTTLPMSQWLQVVHTYEKGQGKIYINGLLDASATPLLAIKSPSRLWIGGWYNNFDFVGDMDEVRISNVTRSADWIKLQYENQKPLQTAVGHLVQPGNDFSVSSDQLTVPEGQTATLTAKAGSAQKVYWIINRQGQETLAAVDRFSFTLDAGRVTGDTSLTLRFKAIYADTTKIKDIPIIIKEDIPEPLFTLSAPANWNGRQTIEVTPTITNLPQLHSKGDLPLHYTWTTSDIAITKEIAPGKLLLTRAQNSGQLTVTLSLDNGGLHTTASTTIQIKEPPRDPWVQRTPDKDEKPQDNQFYARDDKNQGTLYYNGALDHPADAVFLNIYADDQLYQNQTQKLPPNRAYAFSAKLKPGLIKYRAEFGEITGDQKKIISTASNLVCGDAYLIDGQSNAEATNIDKVDYTFTSDWIRSFGSAASGGREARLNRWGNAVFRDNGKLQIGYWGMELARRLVEEQKIPICIINGAVGGTRIDQHQRNQANPEDVTTIYGRLLWRVRQAHLTHGVRGLLWHQGENDQGADGPTGGYGWETYQPYFLEMAAAWKQDYPNLQHYYIFQIWPKSCAMGINGSDNLLREKQRTLPAYFSNMAIMSTLGVKPPGGCHFPPAGYAEFARLIAPLIQRDNYGKVFSESITPPNIQRAYFTTPAKDQIALEFDQPILWTNTLSKEFRLDGAPNQVGQGSATGNTLTLQLKSPSTATKITYLDSASWTPDNLLYGINHIAALTFCDLPILPINPTPSPRAQP